MDGFKQALEDGGLEVVGGGNYPEFLDWRREGFWVVGLVKDRRTIPAHKNKEGKTIKAQEAVTIEIRNCSDSKIVGETRTMSLSGLLNYQLFEDPKAPKTTPFFVGVKYLGRDDEDRHQTQVAFESAMTKAVLA